MNYYLADGGQQKGPFTPEQLAAQGLRADTLVWAEGMSEWQRADRIPALQAVLPPAGGSPAAAAGGAAAQPAAWSQPYPGGSSAPYGATPAASAPYGAAPAYPAAPAYGAPMGYPAAGGAPGAYQHINGKKMGAALCAIILGFLGFGGFGIHKFMLGQTSAGIIMLLVSLVGGVITCGVSTLVMSLIALVEGIIYLTKTDEQFYHEYIVQQKQWF